MNDKVLPQITSKEHALELLQSSDTQVLKLLPLSIAAQCSKEDKFFAQSICLSLADSDNSEIRANAILGLAYIASKHLWLDRRLVTPYIERELRHNHAFNWRIVHAINDINLYLGWNMANKVG